VSFAEWVESTYTWRFREEHDQATKHNSRKHLKTQWQTPLGLVMEANISSVTDPSSNECANPKHELLQRSDCASNGRVGDFRLVKRDDHDQEANTNTCKPSPCPQHVDVRGSRLKRSTEKVDDTSNHNGHSPSESVSRLVIVSPVLNFALSGSMLTGPANPAPQNAPPVKNETTIPL
jgi:hypothetical protein